MIDLVATVKVVVVKQVARLLRAKCHLVQRRPLVGVIFTPVLHQVHWTRPEQSKPRPGVSSPEVGDTDLALRELDRVSFDREVLNSPVPVLVEFWATWCGPCLQVAPEIEALAAAYGDDLRVVKVDVDLNSNVAANYSIQSIPTIELFKLGKMVAQTHGAKRARVIEGDLRLPASIEVGA